MTLKLTILGCGGSAGVPMIGNRWGACDPSEPKNRRTRCSALVQSDNTTLIIDTGPDFRAQMTGLERHELDAILYTHFHGDHINGFEELRYIYKRDRGLIPLYADAYTQAKLREKFPHMFETKDPTGFYPLPIEFKGWQEEQFNSLQMIGDIAVTPFKMNHSDIMAIGYRFGDVAYMTDINALPEESFAALAGVKTMIIDCNNLFDTDGTKIHLNFDGVLELNRRLQVPDVVLTHLKTNCDYKTASERLPDGYRLAYDGLIIGIS